MFFYRNKVQNMNKILAGLVLATITTTAIAQSNTNSPYSQFGLGDLTDQSVGFNKGMNGVGLAMRKGNEVNPMNPASYSAVDSLTMIFDAGLSGQTTNMKENGVSLNAKSGGFDYAVGMFRLMKNVGVSFGVVPYSNIGYKYSSSTTLTEMQTRVASNYEGSGGLHQLYIGAGWRIFKPLSVGFNLSYLWGEYNRSITTASSSAINTLSKQYTADISSYKLDFGMQYQQKLGKNDFVTVGLTWSPGHSLKSDPECLLINRNTTIGKSDTTTVSLTDGLTLPDAYGIGLAYSHANNFRAGADLTMQKWGSVDFPHYDGTSYTLRSDMLKDSYRMNLGAEWTPRPASRQFFSRVHYRFGVGYATPYYYISGQEGPKEYSASLGFGIPIFNGYYANRSVHSASVLNIGFQWVNRSADNLIKENTFRINIGFTFNERWFAKWKVN